MRRALGDFDVELAPLPPYVEDANARVSRMSIDKQYHGDLEAAGEGEMLAAGTSVEGSAAYVAIERVTGTLHGLGGTFVLQHSATMTRGAPTLSITVVPDSGTDQLEGLMGSMSILIEKGTHSYDFEYELPGQ